MNKALDDLERFELLQIMFPDKFGEDADLGDEIDLLEEMGVDVDSFDEIMGRAVMCSMPMTSPLTGDGHHVLGEVTISNGNVHMMAAVKRPIK